MKGTYHWERVEAPEGKAMMILTACGSKGGCISGPGLELGTTKGYELKIESLMMGWAFAALGEDGTFLYPHQVAPNHL